MRDSLHLYFRYLGISLRGQMQYRWTFVFTTLGHGLITGIEFLGIAALFARFGSLRGWSLPEIALLYGIMSLAFAITDGLGRGFDIFSQMLKAGDFDRLLLRPRSTVLQLAGQDLVLKRIGRILQASCILGWAIGALHLAWTPGPCLLFVAAILGGACLFFGLFVLQATLSFWTIESLEVMNVFTYGGVETAQYPLTIYHPWFRRFFTFVIPLACISYFPAQALLGRTPPGLPTLLAWLSPLAGFFFLLISFRVWQFGVRHYRSTGS